MDTARKEAEERQTKLDEAQHKEAPTKAQGGNEQLLKIIQKAKEALENARRMVERVSWSCWMMLFVVVVC